VPDTTGNILAQIVAEVVILFMGFRGAALEVGVLYQNPYETQNYQRRNEHRFLVIFIDQTVPIEAPHLFRIVLDALKCITKQITKTKHISMLESAQLIPT